VTSCLFRRLRVIVSLIVIAVLVSSYDLASRVRPSLIVAVTVDAVYGMSGAFARSGFRPPSAHPATSGRGARRTLSGRVVGSRQIPAARRSFHPQLPHRWGRLPAAISVVLSPCCRMRSSRRPVMATGDSRSAQKNGVSQGRTPTGAAEGRRMRGIVCPRRAVLSG